MCTMCYVLITMIFIFLFFCHYIDYLCLSCVTVVVCAWPVHKAVFLFFMYVCMIRVFLSTCVCCIVTYCPATLHAPPSTRVPGGECRQWGSSGGRGHSRDQCDRRERRANGQRRLPAAAPWWPCSARLRPVGRHLRGQPGSSRSRLRHAGSGGQEAEVCEANGGEWGFWVSLHREEPVLRSCPSFPMPHSWGNLGNRVWRRGLKSCMITSHFTFCSGLHHPLFALIALFLSSVHPTSFTLSFVAKASSSRSPAEIPSN